MDKCIKGDGLPECGFGEYYLKIQLEIPITELSKLIGQKWVLPLERLAEMANVPIGSVRNAVRGKSIHPGNEQKIRAFLENYSGGCQT